MFQYFLTIAYKGTAYHGWQVQPNAKTIQPEIERCLGMYFRKPIAILGSGRTDAGVHATGQVAAIILEQSLPDKELFLYKINKMLPPDIQIKTIESVKPEAHARFDATERNYEYHINLVKNPFEQNECLFYLADLDVAAMNRAADILKTYTDFESLSKVKTDVFTFDCEIMHAYWQPNGHRLTFYIGANRFLRGMVRAIIGTMLQIGRGKTSPEEMHTVLQAKNRSAAGPTASPDGLYLVKVKYPKDIYLPKFE